MGFELRLRPAREFFGNFSLPRTTDKVVIRLRTNAPYFAANYILIVAVASFLQLAVPAFRNSNVSLFSISTFSLIAHALCKTRITGAKVKTFFSDMKNAIRGIGKKKKKKKAM